MLTCPWGGRICTHQVEGNAFAVAMIWSASEPDNDLATLGLCSPTVATLLILVRRVECVKFQRARVLHVNNQVHSTVPDY
jgi:hypothetical protein